MPPAQFIAPQGAVECHSHVYDPARFPYPDPARVFPAHTVADFTAMLATLGVHRAVIVQPSHYMFDNACTLDAVATMNQAGPDTARAVVTPTPACDAAEIARLHAAGGRAARFFLPKGLGWDSLERIAALVAPLGWHIQIQDTDGSRVTDQGARLLALPCPVVIDHLGRIPPQGGTNHPAFVALLKLLATGRVWVKLSAAYYASTAGYPYTDAQPRIEALMQARPDRLVWGANWPHPDQTPKPDDAADFALLGQWLPDPATRRAVLCDNADALYFYA